MRLQAQGRDRCHNAFALHLTSAPVVGLHTSQARSFHAQRTKKTNRQGAESQKSEYQKVDLHGSAGA